MEISRLVRAKGITHTRKPKDIITKIGSLEQSFRAACDFLANTGAGITNEDSLQQAIKSYCPHYDQLKDVMNDRAGTRPMLTTEDEEFRQQESEGSGWNDASPGTRSTVSSIAVSTSSGTRHIPSIRPPKSGASMSVTAWADFNSVFARIKEQEQQNKRVLHEESMQLQWVQMRQNTSLEERRIECTEQESKVRLRLLEAQADKDADGRYQGEGGASERKKASSG